MAENSIVVAAVGDILILRDDPSSMFAHTGDILRSADITFGQLETAYSDKGSLGSSGQRGAAPKEPSNRPAIAQAGFDVISLASNHTLDWGADALLDCVDQLRSDGVTPIGAGPNIAAAREPAIFDQGGTRVAFLAYCSVAPEGYYAASSKPGIAPMRAIAHFEPFEVDQPGTPVQIMTFPVAEDLEALLEDVRAAKEKADVVALSIHWGIHHQRAVIADYQRVVAHAAIDNGVDIILGHHPHVLKGIEVYKGKVIFYSFGNFALDNSSPKILRNLNLDFHKQRAKVDGLEALDPKADGSFRYKKDDQRKTMIAKWVICDGRTERVSFIPGLINEKSEPVPLDPSSPEGKAVLQYVTEITEEADLNAIYTVDGQEVIVSAK
jgi:hypothetical protein